MPTTIKTFKQLGIKPIIQTFTGDHIKIEKVLNQEIIIHKFKIVPSKFEGERLDMQIEYKGENRVLWTTAKYLAQTIQLVNPNDFPIQTTIVKVDEHLEFS